MFGADTPLVMDALTMAAVAAFAGGGAIWLLMRRRKTTDARTSEPMTTKSALEERVEVLERIATDRSIDLADEIEALRDPRPREIELEGQK